MKYSDLYRHLTDLTPEQMNRNVVLYDSLSGETYTPKDFHQGGDGDIDLNIPATDDMTSFITF